MDLPFISFKKILTIVYTFEGQEEWKELKTRGEIREDPYSHCSDLIIISSSCKEHYEYYH